MLHSHADQWEMRFGRSTAQLARWMENRAVPSVYRHRKFVAISRSTADALMTSASSPDGLRSSRRVSNRPSSRAERSPPNRCSWLCHVWSRTNERPCCSRHGDRSIRLRGAGWSSPETATPRVTPRQCGRAARRHVHRSRGRERRVAPSSGGLVPRAELVHEGWGMVILEGAAVGTASLAVDTPGCATQSSTARRAFWCLPVPRAFAKLWRSSG